MFFSYLQLGFEHITDLNGYDHMLFLLVLCASYAYTDWKKILILVTAFTIGHSITLGLAVMQWISVNTAWVEFLIPVTIAATSVKNLVAGKKHVGILTYYMALLFGLIHGLGFSNYLRSLLGDELAMPLFSFNVGLEVGQLLLVALIFGVQALAINTISVKHRYWNIAISTVAGAISLLLAAQRIPF